MCLIKLIEKCVVSSPRFWEGLGEGAKLSAKSIKRSVVFCQARHADKLESAQALTPASPKGRGRKDLTENVQELE